MRFADIAVNLTDPMFTGKYHGRQKHASDLKQVVERAKAQGVDKMLITGTSLRETKEALDMAKEYNLHCTAGCHPTSTNEIAKHAGGEEGYLRELRKLINDDRGEGGSKRIISIGEVGLDYDRLHFSSKEVQLAYLPNLLRLSKEFTLPLFLHSRTPEAHVDLVRILKEVGWSKEWAGGVVHSFTGSQEEMEELVEMGLYIGVNGCSLKTSENLDVAKHIPLDKLLLETDAPWCSVTASHASSSHLPPADSQLLIKRVSKAEKFQEGQGVKGRWEPADVGVIAHIVASLRGISIEKLSEAVWANTVRLFYPQEA